MTEWARNQIRPTSRLFLLLRTLALGFIMAPGGRGRRSPHLATPRKDGLAGEMGEGTMTVYTVPLPEAVSPPRYFITLGIVVFSELFFSFVQSDGCKGTTL